MKHLSVQKEFGWCNVHTLINVLRDEDFKEFLSNEKYKAGSYDHVNEMLKYIGYGDWGVQTLIGLAEHYSPIPKNYLNDLLSNNSEDSMVEIKDEVDIPIIPYFLTEEDEIVYIGITQNIFARMVGHSKKKYDKVFLMETENKNEDLEGEYIFEFSPKYNKSLRSKNIISIPSISSFSGINNFSITVKCIYGKLYIKRSDLEKQNISMIRVRKGRINKYTLKQN